MNVSIRLRDLNETGRAATGFLKKAKGGRIASHRATGGLMEVSISEDGRAADGELPERIALESRIAVPPLKTLMPPYGRASTGKKSDGHLDQRTRRPGVDPRGSLG